ncbi:MAG: glycosyltransferase family 29 protein [Rhizobiaceae bacterium]
MKRLVAVVGNAVLAEGDAERIDASDIVIRFNEPPEGPARIGTRTDLLFVMNSGNSMQARLDGRGYTDSVVFRTARKIILPYHPAIIARYHPKPNILSRLKGRRADWTAKAIAVFGREGKEVTVLPPQFYEDCCDELGIGAESRRRLFPSTGFIGVRYALAKLPADCAAIRLYGFGWEGWKRHAWDAERDWITRHLPPG